jgi:hypothetical protein
LSTVSTTPTTTTVSQRNDDENVSRTWGQPEAREPL